MSELSIMDYVSIYRKLCRRGQLIRQLDEYTEKHHIIPKCMGGSDNKDNLTVLTFREHYLVHRLLCKIHPDHVGLNYAFLCMLRKQPTGKRVLTSRMYETIKKTFRDFQKKNIRLINPGKSEKSRKKARMRMLSEENPVRKNPECNHKAKPIKVIFTDNSVEIYNYAKEFSDKRNIPYDTIKWLLRHNKSSKKHKILSIEQLEKN